MRRIPYSPEHVELLAMVALDTRQIAYAALSDCRTNMHFAAPHADGPDRVGIPGKRLKQMANFTLERALAIVLIGR